MENTDHLFHNILDYLHKDVTGKIPSLENYISDRPYFHLWKIGTEFILKGFSPRSMEAAIEYEKMKLINSRSLTDRELLELILMEEIIYCMHSGNLYEIAQLVQNFASNEIQFKYASVINMLYLDETAKTDKQSNTFDSSQSISLYLEGSDEDFSKKNDSISNLFLVMYSMNQFLLNKQKVLIMLNLIKQGIPDSSIRHITDADEKFYNIVKRGYIQNLDADEILLRLDSGTASAQKIPDYKDMTEAETRIYQTALYYKKEVSLSYEIQMIRLIRNAMEQNDLLKLLPFDQSYTKLVIGYIRQYPSLSDREIAELLASVSSDQE